MDLQLQLLSQFQGSCVRF
uniref:Uncharacterized protein n=1 Tax=Rhizophora mucronata TaxID=61149 RepID=A0A2P2NW62_RHIMU